MNTHPVGRLLLGIATALAVATAFADLTLYKDDNYKGDSRNFRAGAIGNLKNEGFNDTASSITIHGGDSWEVCTDADFRGDCRTLGPGKYPSLRSIGAQRQHFIRSQDRSRLRQQCVRLRSRCGRRM